MVVAKRLLQLPDKRGASYTVSKCQMVNPARLAA